MDALFNVDVILEANQILERRNSLELMEEVPAGNFI